MIRRSSSILIRRFSSQRKSRQLATVFPHCSVARLQLGMLLDEGEQIAPEDFLDRPEVSASFVELFFGVSI